MDARIRLEHDVSDDRVADLVGRHEDPVAEEVRAEEFAAVDDGHRKTQDVEGVAVEIAIEPLAAPPAPD